MRLVGTLKRTLVSELRGLEDRRRRILGAIMRVRGDMTVQGRTTTGTTRSTPAQVGGREVGTIMPNRMEAPCIDDRVGERNKRSMLEARSNCA